MSITLEEIKALPAELLAGQDTQALADALSVGRTKSVSKEIGDGGVTLALGGVAGCLFLYQLEKAANSEPGDGATPEQIANYAVAREAWRSIVSKSLDVGNAGTRAMLDAFVGVLLTQDQADALKALADTDDPVSVADVSEILNAEGIAP